MDTQEIAPSASSQCIGVRIYKQVLALYPILIWNRPEHWLCFTDVILCAVKSLPLVILQALCLLSGPTSNSAYAVPTALPLLSEPTSNSVYAVPRAPPLPF